MKSPALMNTLGGYFSVVLTEARDLSATDLTSSPRAVRDSACMLLTSGPSEGCIQHCPPVILIPSQISLQKQTDVDGCHDV